MARIGAQIKAGYYPTPIEAVEMICSFVQSEEAEARIFDPCAGEGIAIEKIAHHLQVLSYGIELDGERAEAAKGRLTKVVKGDLFRVSAKKGCFSLMLLNPPYDYEEAEKGRLEHKFLVETTPYLQPGGVLIYVVPQKRISKRTARYLASWYEKFLIYRFPGKSYEQFGQIVVFAVKKKNSDLDAVRQQKLEAVPWTELTELGFREEPVYTILKNRVEEKDFYLRSLEIDPDELQKEVDEHGAWPQAERLMRPPDTNVRGRVLMPLRKGHLAILMACGLCNTVLNKDGKRLLIKGVTRKEQVETVEYAGNAVIERKTDVIKIGIKALDLDTGDLLNIE